jgi:hypothetical protein
MIGTKSTRRFSKAKQSFVMNIYALAFPFYASKRLWHRVATPKIQLRHQS